MGSKLQLEQVLINFLINARDALEGAEEGIITISTKMIENPTNDSIWVVAAVQDNGKGISQEDLNQIFKPFFTLKTQAGGTGLGLSLSLGIAQTHGGTIEVWSELGKGSKFSLMLPL